LYQEYENRSLKKYEERLKEIQKTAEAWQNKTCLVCGSKLRKVNSTYGSFWGCPNFNDGRKHTTFSMTYHESLSIREAYARVVIRANWSVDLIMDLNLPSYVKASDMLIFLERIGLEDLRYKYGYKKSMETIGGYVLSKKASRKEAVEIESFLKTIFPKLASQVGIRYKLQGEEERVRVIDLIASDNNAVYIIEIKRESLQIKEDQLHQYLALLRFIKNQKNDTRKYRAVPVVYTSCLPYGNYSGLSMKFVSFDDLKKAGNHTKISELLNRAGIG
jgi:ssDNA-binding Zn-finger/Zn-ribbon topoisomerase 1